MNYCLQNMGYNIATMDINKHLAPTYVKDISEELFFHDKTYDVISCCEVLEHIPFDKFEKCIENISHMCNDYLFLTLPNARKIKKLSFSTNWKRYEKIIETKKINDRIDMAHFWEPNFYDFCTENEINNVLIRRFEIVESGVVPCNTYHYYWILKK